MLGVFDILQIKKLLLVFINFLTRKLAESIIREGDSHKRLVGKKQQGWQENNNINATRVETTSYPLRFNVILDTGQEIELFTDDVLEEYVRMRLEILAHIGEIPDEDYVSKEHIKFTVSPDEYH